MILLTVIALGQVTVRQMEEGWAESDVKLYMNNTLYPNADIGGVVATTAVDISPVISITYESGYIHMGSNWNKYGVPPNQEVVIDGGRFPPAPCRPMGRGWPTNWGITSSSSLTPIATPAGAGNEAVAALCTGSYRQCV
ncbi:MAG: hypothetical protein R2911_43450 [Caldilineaceae bacterium]